MTMEILKTINKSIFEDMIIRKAISLNSLHLFLFLEILLTKSNSILDMIYVYIKLLDISMTMEIVKTINRRISENSIVGKAISFNSHLKKSHHLRQEMHHEDS